MKHEYGTAPIQPEYAEQMKEIVMTLDCIFNGEKRGADRPTGFVLLVFPFGEKEGRCNYISNGADRADMIKLLREQANRFDTNTQ